MLCTVKHRGPDLALFLLCETFVIPVPYRLYLYLCSIIFYEHSKGMFQDRYAYERRSISWKLWLLGSPESATTTFRHQATWYPRWR
jgi:hypothetical protein